MMTMTAEEHVHQRENPIATIVSLVELVQSLQTEQRSATYEEREMLASWMGWGPVAPAFERFPQGLAAEVGARLRLLLGPAGTEAAMAATPHSFFTDQYIARAIWEMAVQLGFSGGKVLEPGCGLGAFLAAAPDFLQEKIAFTGIEREPFSAAIAQLRFPTARIVNAALEKTAIVADLFDLVVGNVPFANIKIYDPDSDLKMSLHNYFLWRAIHALRPSGLAILITSRFTLDAMRDNQREQLGRNALLLGVLRLPTHAHKAASTEVVTDILLLQKRSPQIGWQGHPWMESMAIPALPQVPLNEYFAEHMANIIGEAFIDEHGMYGQNELKVKAPPDIERAIYEATIRIIAEAQRRGAIYLPPIDRTIIGDNLIHAREDGRKEGSFHLNDNVLVQIVDGQDMPVTKMIAELTALVHLRDAATSLLEQERDLDKSDEALAPLRQRLNRSYDAYVKAFGAIHRAKVTIGEEDPETGQRSITRRRPAAMYAFSRDPDYCVVLGLEIYDDTTKQATKAAIFSHRVHTRPIRKDHADTPGEALALCLDEKGILDFPTITALLSVEEEELPALLGDLVYEMPGTNRWMTASEYLSGNVRLALEDARKAVEKEGGERFVRNVAALEKVMPEDLLPEEIKVLMGAAWVPTDDIVQFCQDMLGLRPEVSFERLTGSWQVRSPSDARYSPAATSEWGTSRMNAFRLVEVGLNKGTPVVYDIMPDETKVKNVEETLAAQDKLRILQARFSDWVWEDQERAVRLAKEYNRLFNSVVPREHDGSHLSFPGMSTEWETNMYSWQKDFVWRMISSPSALCAHPVGAGKTTTEIAGAMKLKQLGLVTKAAIVVPNHLLEQITAEAQRLYPGASILMVSRDDLSKERRKLFAARIATGDYDFVVMTHSGLGSIGVHPETEKAYIDHKIAIYREAAIVAEENDTSNKKYSVKKLEKAIETLKQRLEELIDIPHDDGITFEQLGISYLIIDEFHFYKNLGLPTNVQGLQVKASKRATDLEMKFRWLEEHNEGRPFASGFTATPISNSMVEAYVIAWYLDQKLLANYNLYNVDAFASAFIELQTKVEVSPDGGSFRLNTRPSRFVNVPEFLRLFTQFADLRDPDILAGKRPQRRDHTTVIEPDETLTDYINDLVARSDEIRQGKPRAMGDGKRDNMLWVTSNGREAALDPSLVGLPQEHSPKLEAVANNMLEVFNRWQEEASYLEGPFKSLQIGFCDLGTPNEQDEQTYGKLKRLLIRGGISSHGVRYIHEAKTDAAKALLFEQCRSGEVAILLGSTAKLGTGTNIQTRAAALHHVDAPWRPDEVEQREGRIQRPGNLYPEVEIFRTVTRRTFDAYSWQTLERKAVFFDQLRKGKIKGREVEEVGDSALTYGQVKAAATGDPLILEQADLGVTIAHLQRLKSAHIRSRGRDVQEAKFARAAASDCVRRADRLQEIAEQATSEKVFVTPQGERLEERNKIGDFIADKVLGMLNRGGGQDYIGTYRGVMVQLTITKYGTQYAVDLYLGGKRWSSSSNLTNCVKLHITNQEWIAKGQTWRFAHTLEQFVSSAAETVASEKEEATQHLLRANTFEQRAQEPFPQEEEVQHCFKRKALLDDYTKLAAEKGGNEEKQQEVARLREQLLVDAPRDFSEVQVVQPTRVPPPRRPVAIMTPVVEVKAPRIVEAIVEEKEEEEKTPAVTLIPATIFTVHKFTWEQMRQQALENKPTKRAAKKKKKEPVAGGEGLWSFNTEEQQGEVIAATLW